MERKLLKFPFKLISALILASTIVACEQPGGDSEGGGGEDESLTTPVFTSVSPASPSNSNTITLSGTGPKKKKIKFYLDATCTTLLAQTDSTSAGTFTYTNTVPLVSDMAYTIYAKAVSTTGESSPCSTGIDYIEDSTAPSTPTSLLVNPTSANNNNPVVSGTTSPGENVVVYSDASCLVALATDVADSLGNFSFSVPVIDNNSYTLRVKSVDAAGNSSPCTGALAYTEDSNAPAAPTGLSTTPASPNLSDTPSVIGTAEPNSAIGIYSNSACASLLSLGTADGTGNFSIQVNVGANTTQWFYAKATDAAGNASPCSTSNIKYVNDSLSPAINSLTLGSASPYNNNNPFINGTTEGDSSVSIYSDAGCTTLKGTGTSTAGGVFSIQVNVADNTSTNFHAKPTDAAGNIGICTSFFVTFVEDSVPPASPSSLSTTPASPSGSNFPQVTGQAEAGTTVRIYSNSSCTTYLGQGVTDGTGIFAVAVNVANDATTTLYANATDAAGSTSPCSTSTVSYTHDSGPPAAPTGFGVAPSSPNTSTTVTISGTSEASAVVRLYVNGSCSGGASATGSADSNGFFAIPVTVNANSSTTFWAQATDLASNVGPCSTEQITFVNDTIQPSAPVGLAVTPVSPANNNSPSVSGTAEANAFVTIFSDGTCTTAVGSGNAAANGSFSVTASVLDNTSSTFYAKAMDLAGNVGPCSTVFAAYIEDSVVPLTPSVTGVSPLSPANNNGPTISGSTDPNVTVRLYTNSTCSNLDSTGASDGAGFFSIPTTVSNNTSTTYWARATDAAGNNSACSASNILFVEDSDPPTTPVGLGVSPLSPANNNNPSITGFSDAGAAIEVFNDVGCTSLRGSGTVTGGGTFSIPVNVFNDTSNTYYAVATDAAGNPSACSTAYVTYVEDSIAPAAPTGLASNPLSPANANNITVGGNTDANATVGVYTDSLCTNLTATGTANGSGVFSINVIVSDNTTTTFYAKTTDQAGNPGPCSTSFVTYVEDSSLPATPSSLVLTPSAAANNNNTPNISGVSEPNATVRIYTNAICTTLTATTTADGSGMWNVNLSVTDDTTTTFWARSTDGASNNSPCSAENVTYVEDSTAPGVPASLAVTPVSPSSNNSPSVSGLTDANTSVSVYSDVTCSTVRGSGTSNGGGVFSIAVTVFADTSTTYYAKSVDVAGNQSACSTSNVTYVEDSTAPAAPSALASTPSGTANNNNPLISGSAEANANIAIYTDPSCSSAIVATGAASGGGSFSIGVSVLNNTSTTFYAKATDAAANAGPCSSSNVNYVEDSSAPAVPSGLAVSPLGPANNNSPVLTGSTDANATVSVYTNSSCTSGVFASGNANGSGNFSITLPVANDSSGSFWALAQDGAGNQSACSTTSVSYVEDSLAPALPLALSVTPLSPANNEAPFISGSAEANSSVSIYADSGCTDLKGTGSANGIGTFSIQIAVTNNSTTTFYAKATDAASNQSGCSTANVVFVEDSNAPTIPVSLTVSPLSPANNNNITVGGTTEANVNVALYTDSACTSAIAGSGSSNGGGMFSIPVAVSDNTTTTFYAKATDAANNSSTCSIASVVYVEDSAAPAVPAGLAASPASPSPVNTPDITGTAEANASINIYTNSSCTSSVVGTGSANGVGNFGVSVALTSDTNYALYATATDASGNTSACSTSTVSYVEDSTAPGLPVGFGVSPASPAADNNPFVTGSAEANSNVSVYSDAGCTTLKGTGAANGLGSFSIQVAVSDNSTTIFYAKATDAAGNVGGCSTANVGYIEDSDGPSAPTGLASSPIGPTNNNNITISGTAEANTSVALYTNSSCTSGVAGSGTANGGGLFSIPLSVSDNTTTTFYAKSTDGASNSSPCSTANVSYTEDSAAPTAPSGLASSPASPSPVNNPDITGTAEANATINIYTNSSCTSGVVGTGSANGVGNFGVSVALTADTSYTLYATATDSAGNASACSTSSVAYVEDSTAPGLPVGLDVNPVSPANDNNPFITGSAEANSSVSVYSDSSCSTLKGTGSASGLGVFNIQVSVTGNTSTTFYAKATDAAGNIGNCSTVNVTFVEDSNGPSAPTGLASAPVGPANNNNITISGSAEANASVAIYTNSGCSSSIAGSGSANGGGSFSIALSVSDNTSTTYYAKATDAANNASACSTANVTYVEDSAAPAAPAALVVSPVSPSPNNNPDISGTAEANAAITLYTNSSCTSAVAGTGSANGVGNFSINVTVGADTSTTFYATATDASTNTSVCSTSNVVYVEDSTAPGLPVGLDVSPVSPANDNNPFVTGSAEANSSVSVYSDSGCTTLKGTGSANGLGVFNIQVSVTNNTSTTFYAKATDAAGNVGNCSTVNVSFVEDSTAPGAPTGLAVAPVGPANQNNITVSGNAEANSAVAIYTNSSCTSAIAVSGSANGAGSFSLGLAVADNTSTAFYAIATDFANNSSACSTATVTYVEDSAAPTAPTGLATSPVSPNTSGTPDVIGLAEANAVINLYTNSSCSSSLAGTTSASGAGNFTIPVSVSPDTTTSYYATATDSSGNTSLCSTAFVTYVEDSTPPGLPTGLVTNPLSPNLDIAPYVNGTAEANATVKVYSDSSCSTLKGTGAANGIGAFSVQVSISGNSTTTFYAQATDVAGNVGGCSTEFYTYINDNIPPAAPVFTGVTPSAGPANQNSITLLGTAEANTTYLLYSDLNCTNQIATGAVDGAGNFSINRTVSDDTTSSFYAKVRDISQNVSPCSSTFVTYIEDSSAPNPPINLASTPSLPANNNENPSISGNAEANSTLKLYTNSACSGGAFATDAVNGSGAFSIAIAVASNSSNTFWASATDSSGNASSCSPTSIAYVEDSINPAAPGGLDVNPASPNPDTAPNIVGSAEPNSTVKVYSDSGCSVLKGTGTASGIGAFDIEVSVTNNSTTTFYAQATDSANNVGPCSTSNVTYINDVILPAVPTGLAVTPDGPANQTNITVGGSTEANATVLVYSNSTCSTLVTTGAANGSGTFNIAVTVADDSTTTFYAKSRDAAQNLSACSTSNDTYVEDSTPPAAPPTITTNPLSPSSNNDPTVTGTAEASSNVDLYTNSTCTSGVFATGAADGSGNFAIPVSLSANTTYTFWAKARDLANNPGPCSSVSTTYVEDSIAPAAPTALASNPNAASNNNNNPTISGAAEANSTIRIYSDSSCTTLRATTAANGSGIFGTPVAVGDDTTTTFYATSQDTALNTSLCSSTVPSSVTYVEDSTDPTSPLFGSPASSPTSPSNVNSPNMLGTAEVGSTVTVYSDPGCSTVAGVDIAEDGTFAAPVSVSADTTNTFYAKSVDPAGNSSACSTSTGVYVEDSIVPATPSILSFSPNSPSPDETPSVAGSGEPNSSIDLYTNASCTSALAGFGSANGAGLFNITNVTVGENTVTTFYALSTDAAGNSSACSSGLTFTEDSAAPGAPVSLAVTGGSPQSDNTPNITGNAEAFSIVRLYTTSDCSGAAVNPAGDTVPVTTLFDIQVTVSGDTTTTFYARATDPAGNLGPCSSNYVTYVEDSSPPIVPNTLATNPANFGNDPDPDVTGNTEASVSVAIYSTPDCSGAPVGSGSSLANGTFALPSTATANTTTTFYAKATDSIGNASLCSGLDSPPKSVAYIHDNIAPAAPNTFVSNPTSPSSNNSPTISGNAEANSTVKIWTSISCDSGFVTQGSASGSGTFAISPTLAANTTHTLYFTATDQAGNPGACSASFTYIEDSIAPAAPVFGVPASSPISPSFDPRPNLLGTAAVGSTVKFYTNSICTSSVVGTGTTDGSGNFAIQIDNGVLTSDGTTTFYATATDAALNEGSCSGGGSNVPYTLDTVNPADPTIAIAPATSPNQATSVTISGAAESLATVKLYTNGSCTEPSATSGISVAGAYSIPYSVTANVTTVLTTKVFDPANNQSNCSSVITYTNDTIAPVIPNNLNVSPTSPNPSNDITVTGNSAEPNSWVFLYTNIDCTSAVFASGQADAGGAFSINKTGLTSNTTYDIFMRSQDAALNASGCSGIVYGQVAGRWVQYVEDSSPPGDPTIGFSPNNPNGNNDNYPDISGTTSPNATVKVYTNGTCTEPYAAQAAANGSGAYAFNASGAQDAQAAADVTTTFSVKAWDAAGNASGCTAGSYLEDSTAPGQPTGLAASPVGPANNNNPSISGSAEANSTVKLYTDSFCSGGIAAQGSANGVGSFSITAPVTGDVTTNFFATATDAAGNASACSTATVSYTEDSTPPSAPTFSSSNPVSPSDDHTPVISGTAEANSTVKLYSDSSCTTQIASGSASGGGTFAITPTFSDDTSTDIYLTATDAAGNASSCPVTADTTFVQYSIPEGMGYWEGYRTVLSTDISSTTASPLQWNNLARYHSTYYTHSLTTNSDRIYVNVDGHYLVSLSLGVSTVTNAGDIRLTTRVNGAVQGQGTGVAHAYVMTGTKIPTSNMTVLIPNLTAGDYIDITSVQNGAAATVSGNGISLMVKYIDPNGPDIFYATATSVYPAAPTTNFNNSTERKVIWTEITPTISSSIYTHSNSTNPDEITFTEAGSYRVHLNVPLETTTNYGSVKFQVYTGASGTTAVTGATSARVNGTTNPKESSNQWHGVVTVSANDKLTIGAIQEAAAATMTTVSGRSATIYIEKLPDTNKTFRSRGSATTGGTNFNDATARLVTWTTDDIIDTGVFTHSTGSNPESITVLEAGDYELTYSDALVGAVTDSGTLVTVLKNGSPITNAKVSSTMIENTSSNNESSNTLHFLLKGIAINDVITVQTVANYAAGTLTGNATISLRKLTKSSSP